MFLRITLWVGAGGTGIGLLFAGITAPSSVLPVVAGLMYLFGTLGLAIGVLGAAWDLVRLINARFGFDPGASRIAASTPSSTSAQIPIKAPLLVHVPSVTNGQPSEWELYRQLLIEEGEEIAAALRVLVLSPTDDGLRKDPATARLWRTAKNWTSSVDDLEAYWRSGTGLGNYLTRTAASLAYKNNVPVARPSWRQSIAHDVEFRLDRLRTAQSLAPAQSVASVDQELGTRER